MYYAWKVEKFEFWRTPILLPPKFVKFYISFIFTYLKHFMYPTKKVKNFEFWRARLGGIAILDPHFLLDLFYFWYLPLPKIWSIKL